MKKNITVKNKTKPSKTSLSKENVSFKKDFDKESGFLKKINFKLNILLIILTLLLILGVFFVAFYSVNMVFNNLFSEDDSFEIKSIEVVNLPVDTVNNSDVNFKINDLNLNTGQLLNEYLVTKENKAYLENSFSFLFNENLIKEYEFLLTEVGDSILEYDNYLLVYNKDLNLKKSVWNIDYID